MWNINILIVFIHICNLRGLYLSWYSYLHIFFVCICFLQIVGEVIWHGRWCPLPHREVFHWYGPKIIFCSMYTSVSPQKHFFNIMNLVGIASHITCTFLSDYSINFHVYMLIYVYIWIFLHIFCLGMLGIDCGCRDMAWQVNPSHIGLKVTVTFLSGGHHPQDLTLYETDIYLCQMFEYFYIFECILPHLDTQYHIHHTFIIVSYTCAICHLHCYPT